MTQPAHGPCPECRRDVPYVRRDPWAFDWCCGHCGAAGVLCWDEDELAPEFDGRCLQQEALDFGAHGGATEG